MVEGALDASERAPPLAQQALERAQRLKGAVLDAYGWPHDLSDEEILERLLALNLERAEKEG